MTLEEAIRHCEEKAEELKKDYERAVALNIPSEGCLECANEHEQLAEWLTELQERREADRWIPVSERLPDKNNYYYVWFSYNGEESACVSWFCEDFILNSIIGFKVIAWKQTLCEPYKKDGVE